MTDPRPTPRLRRAAATAVIMLFAFTMSAAAQDRMPPVPPDKLTDAQKKAAAEFAADRKVPVFGPFVPLLRSPELMLRAMAMGDYLRFNSTLPPRLSEFVILMTAREWTQRYEWTVHYQTAVGAGLNPEIAQALADGRRPEKMAEDEDLLYAFCAELNRNQSVSDATYARMVSKFGEQGVVDAVGIMGYYTLLAMVLNTARTPADPDTAPALTPFPR